MPNQWEPISTKSKYQMIADEILRSIVSGKFDLGDRLPSENQLATTFGVNRNTIRQAVSLLVAQGMVRRVQGRGAFVTSTTVKSSENGGRFVGLIVPTLGNPFFSQVAREVEKALRPMDLHLILKSSSNNESLEAQTLTDLVELGVQGVLLAPVLGEHVTRTTKLLKDYSLPSVYIDRFSPELHWVDADSVVIDHQKGAKEMVQWLISQGYRRIVFVASQPFTSVIEQRLKGYEDALDEAGIEIDERLVIISDSEEDLGGEKAVESLNGISIDAIFGSKDSVAIGIIRGLQKSGIKVPDEVAVVGFDDIEIAHLMNPALTTVSQPISRLAREAVSALDARLLNPHTSPSRIVLPTRLIIRGSTKIDSDEGRDMDEVGA